MKYVMRNGLLVAADKKPVVSKKSVTVGTVMTSKLFRSTDGAMFYQKDGKFSRVIEIDGRHVTIGAKFNRADIEGSIQPCDDKIEVCTLCKWERQEPLRYDDIKAVEVLNDKKQIVDYRDVMFAGYGSTFENVTARDRDGDAVMQGSFSDTITEFMKNPVMLIDHNRSVASIAGSYSEVKQDRNGLYVVGNVSNSPEMRHVRFLLKEKHLRTLSMGGAMLFDETGRNIIKVYLYEISLVAIPANPDALITTFAMDADDEDEFVKKFKNAA